MFLYKLAIAFTKYEYAERILKRLINLACDGCSLLASDWFFFLSLSLILSFCGLFQQYITTVIPYHQGNGPPTNATVQVLIKSELPILMPSPLV